MVPSDTAMASFCRLAVNTCIINHVSIHIYLQRFGSNFKCKVAAITQMRRITVSFSSADCSVRYNSVNRRVYGTACSLSAKSVSLCDRKLNDAFG